MQSWVWNWHRTQLVCPSLITHLLFLLLQASQGLSFRLRTFVPESPDVELLMLAESCDLPLVLLWESSIEGSKRGFLEAIAIGAVLAMDVGVDMA